MPIVKWRRIAQRRKKRAGPPTICSRRLPALATRAPSRAASCNEMSRLGRALLAGGAALLIHGWATSTPQFHNITRAAGIEFIHQKGSRGVPTILEEAGPGVCVADYDADGYPDIYFVNGRDLSGHDANIRNALYRNNGDGTFRDVTEKAGVPGTA